MNEVTVWFNPKCGTCQKVKTALEAKGYKLNLVEYLKTPPSIQEIDEVCQKAGIAPQQLARQKEPVYASVAKKNLDRKGWLQALHENPVLIERPMVITKDRAIIARPPEKLQELF